MSNMTLDLSGLGNVDRLRVCDAVKALEGLLLDDAPRKKTNKNVPTS